MFSSGLVRDAGVNRLEKDEAGQSQKRVRATMTAARERHSTVTAADGTRLSGRESCRETNITLRTSSGLSLRQWSTDSGRRSEIEITQGRNLRYGMGQPLVIGKQTKILDAANLEILGTRLNI